MEIQATVLNKHTPGLSKKLWLISRVLKDNLTIFTSILIAFLWGVDLEFLICQVSQVAQW